MTPEKLLAHFDRICGAPDAVPRLRHVILNLAVRGKLVEQDPNDEPASELLKRIQAEKERLVKEGMVRKQEPLPPFDEHSSPFPVPKHWTWLPLTGVGIISGGMTPSKNRPDFWDGDINWFSPKDVKSDELVESELKITSPGVTETGLQVYRPGCLFMVARSGILKRTFPVSINRVEATANQDLKVLTPFIGGLERYLQIMFRGMTDFILSTLVKTGTTVQSLKYEEFEIQPIPLPPLAEQHRIVAKVNELMALCDRLEAAQAERESRRDRLAATSLHRLNNGADADEFHEHARFHLLHLPRLATRPEHIQQLRQTILNLAVRGKLVPQDPNDEPASELLGDHQIFPDSEMEPWKLPTGWAWSSFNLIGKALGGGTPSKANPEFWSGSIPWVSPKDMKVDLIKDTEDHISELAVEQSSTRLIPTGSLLMVVRGMILAHSFPTAISTVPLTINQDMKVIVPFRAELIRMLLLVTKGLKPEVLRLVLRSTHGTCKLLTDDLFSLPLPIPPLAEQHRVVAKVDELMALCDHLEAQLTTTQTESRHLLDAVLHEALKLRTGNDRSAHL
jgi:type I restriction enzyme S subunit